MIAQKVEVQKVVKFDKVMAGHIPCIYIDVIGSLLKEGGLASIAYTHGPEHNLNM